MVRIVKTPAETPSQKKQSPSEIARLGAGAFEDAGLAKSTAFRLTEKRRLSPAANPFEGKPFYVNPSYRTLGAEKM